MADDRGDVDDDPAALAAHHGQGGLAAVHGAEVVHAHQPLVRCDRRVLDAPAHAVAGVVDQHVQAPEALDGGGQEPADLLRLRDVGLQDQHVAAVRADLAGERVEPVEPARARRHPRALAGEGEHALPPDPGGGAGDGHDGAAQGQGAGGHLPAGGDSWGLPRPLLMKSATIWRSGPGSALRSSRQW